MKKYLKTVALLLLSLNAMAQTNGYPTRKFTIEPAIGTRISTAFGLVDLQISCLTVYNPHRRLSLASHTAFSFDINRFKAFKNIDVKYSMTTFQKFGVGTTIYTKKTAHSFLLMVGGKYFTYSAHVNNDKLEDKTQTKFNSFVFDKGFMYNLKIGNNSRYFSSRIYAPVFDGKWRMIENTAIELGAGLQLK